jgi:hypothetical protein
MLTQMKIKDVHSLSKAPVSIVRCGTMGWGIRLSFESRPYNYEFVCILSLGKCFWLFKPRARRSHSDASSRDFHMSRALGHAERTDNTSDLA